MQRIPVPDVLFTPAGRCIYCGADRYAVDSTRPLADEHIVPFGLNGNLILPRASCLRCERMTGRFESLLLRGALLGCRTHLGLRTRKPKERPKKLPLFIPTQTPNKKVMVAIEDYPASLLLPHLATPHRFTGQTLETARARTWFRFFRRDLAVLKNKYGIGQFALPALDMLALSQTLAKIAHAYAVAKLGLAGFAPVLLPLLRGEEDDNRFHYVGGCFDDHPANDSLHEIDLKSCKHGDDDCLLARIRLFAHLGAPEYWVFAGLLKPGHRLQPHAFH